MAHPQGPLPWNFAVKYHVDINIVGIVYSVLKCMTRTTVPDRKPNPQSSHCDADIKHWVLFPLLKCTAKTTVSQVQSSKVAIVLISTVWVLFPCEMCGENNKLQSSHYGLHSKLQEPIGSHGPSATCNSV